MHIPAGVANQDFADPQEETSISKSARMDIVKKSAAPNSVIDAISDDADEVATPFWLSSVSNNEN